MFDEFEGFAFPINKLGFHSTKILVLLLFLLVLAFSESISVPNPDPARMLIAQQKQAFNNDKDDIGISQNRLFKDNANQQYLPFISGRSYYSNPQIQQTERFIEPDNNIQNSIIPDSAAQKRLIKAVQRKISYKKPKILPVKSEIQVSALIKNEFSAFESNQIFLEQLQKAKQWMQFSTEDYQLSEKTIQEYNYYQKKYKISIYQQLPFCVVVPTYNNIQNDRHLRNIRSILTQNYSNFRVVIIDDNSNDGTGDSLEKFMAGQTKLLSTQYSFIRNKFKKQALVNIRTAAFEYCQPEEIFLIVDGDDQLIGRQVLKLFNSVFQKDKAWFVYSNFIVSKTETTGYSRPFSTQVFEKNTFRYYPFVTSHLRAYYTQLLRNIRDEDLKDQNGQYFSAANDVAICLLILQQSKKRVSYLPQVTYWYNSNTGQNNHKLRAFQQRENEYMIRRKAQYQPLEWLFEEES